MKIFILLKVYQDVHAHSVHFLLLLPSVVLKVFYNVGILLYSVLANLYSIADVGQLCASECFHVTMPRCGG